MTLSNSTDSNGFTKLVNSTPAITDYLGPGAKTGSPLHRSFVVSLQLILRYVLLLYAQPANFSKQNISAPATRKDFNLTEFEATLGVSAPIGGNTFLVGDSSSGPSSVPSSTATHTTAMPSPSSTGKTSAASRVNIGIELNFSLLLLVCGLIFYNFGEYYN
jgi:hypothetical protein